MTIFQPIETKRLYLRELTLADRESVFQHFANPNVTRFMDIEPCRGMEEVEEIIQFHIQDSGCRYGIFNKMHNQFIGTAGYHCWNPNSPSSAEIGFDLSPSYWGQGLMQEALEAMIPIGWNVMNLDWVEATVEPENIQSQRLLNKLEFVKSDELQQGLFYYTLHRESIPTG
ncbi:GNAT family N-acetyltransferase [Paenibacillus sp. TC-CSREp1]|uniref:GNAT family N-acetyltransferase n=1 Tax=Paenibacillus sp. TC-CSREp1 TaxID=3410089 RepID=UPI003CE85967